jgi:SAM-dependent methyltransferase
MNEQGLGPEHFARIDESDDALFYTEPRLVTHIDDEACIALSDHFATILPEGGEILDLMSAWVSHLPDNAPYRRVAGLGMNEVELSKNGQLTEWLVHDLTETPALPYGDSEFDACLINVSVQYLTHPVEVFANIARVLKPGGLCAVSFSNRMFPTKAIAAWRGAGDKGHAQIIAWYFQQAGGFETPAFSDLSPNPGMSDPLYKVSARTPG